MEQTSESNGDLTLIENEYYNCLAGEDLQSSACSYGK